MKELYLKFLGLLTGTGALTYIDEENGQLNVPNPPIGYPAGLIDIAYTSCEDTVRQQQRVRALVTITLAFDDNGDNTSSSFDNTTISNALSHMDVIDVVYSALQSYYDDDIDELSRKSMVKQKRNDKVKVYVIPFETYFDDVTAMG